MAWNGKSFWAILVALCSLVSISACSAGADSTTTEVSGEVASTVDPTPTSGIYLADGEFVPFGEYDGVTTSRLMDPCVDLPLDSLESIGFPGEHQESTGSLNNNICLHVEPLDSTQPWRSITLGTTMNTEGEIRENAVTLDVPSSETFNEIFAYTTEESYKLGECFAAVGTQRGTLFINVDATDKSASVENNCQHSMTLLETLLFNNGGNNEN